MNARSTALSLATVAVLSACGGASSQAGSREPAPGRSGDVVTLEELGRNSSTNLYDALRSLRPHWFRKTPTTLDPRAEGDIVVYLDQSRLGGLESLRTIFISSVTTVRYFGPSEAQGRFGLGHLHGAIQVSTSR